MHTLLKALVRIGFPAVVGAISGGVVLVVLREYLPGGRLDLERLGLVLTAATVPLGVTIAVLTLIFRAYTHVRSSKRAEEEKFLAMALDWTARAVRLLRDLRESTTRRQPLWSADSRLKWETAADLLEEAYALRKRIRSVDLAREYDVGQRIARSGVADAIGYLSTGDIFNLTHYQLAEELSGSSKDLSHWQMINLAFYHNNTIDLLDELGSVPRELDEDRRKRVSRLFFFRRRLGEGQKVFEHPFMGSAVPISALETVLRFGYDALGDGRPYGEVRQGSLWRAFAGIDIFLYQALYFENDDSGRAINVHPEYRREGEEEETAPAPNP